MLEMQLWQRKHSRGAAAAEAGMVAPLPNSNCQPLLAGWFFSLQERRLRENSMEIYKIPSGLEKVNEN